MWLASSAQRLHPEHLTRTVTHLATFMCENVHSIFHLSQHFYEAKQSTMCFFFLGEKKPVVYYANISLLANVSMPLKIASHLADCLGSKLYPFFSPLLALLSF